MGNKLSKLIYVCIVAVVLTILMPTRVEAITNLNQKIAKKTGVTITWKKSAGEVSYQVEYEKSIRTWTPSKVVDASAVSIEYKNQKMVRSGKMKKTSYSCSGLQAGRVYKIKVRAFDKDGKEIPSAMKTIEAKTLPGKPDVFYAGVAMRKVSGENKSEQLSNEYLGRAMFLLQDSADGYQVKINNMSGDCIAERTFSVKEMKEWYDAEWDSTDKKTGVYAAVFFRGKIKQGYVEFYENVTNTPVYKMQIRAYQNYKGKKVYSSWATGYGIGQVVAQVRKKSDGSVQFRWNTSKDFIGYDLYIRDEKVNYTASIKLTKMIDYWKKSMGKNVTTTSLSAKHFKKGKTYYYLVVAKKKVGKKTYISSINDCVWLKFKY